MIILCVCLLHPTDFRQIKYLSEKANPFKFNKNRQISREVRPRSAPFYGKLPIQVYPSLTMEYLYNRPTLRNTLMQNLAYFAFLPTEMFIGCLFHYPWKK